jgi:hypothetical protein
MACGVFIAWGTVALAEGVKPAPIPPGMKNMPRASYAAGDSSERRALLDRHRAFFRALIEERKLRLVGPFADGGPESLEVRF